VHSRLVGISQLTALFSVRGWAPFRFRDSFLIGNGLTMFDSYDEQVGHGNFKGILGFHLMLIFKQTS
jgi:hypothetical protein